MKIFQYDKKVWENGETSHTWQFGILKNRSLLWVNYENPTNHHWSSGGFHIVFSFLSSSLFGVELNNDKQCLAFEFFTEYSEGFEDYDMMIGDDEFGAPFLRQKAREFSDMYFYRDYMPKIALYAYRHFALKYKETHK